MVNLAERPRHWRRNIFIALVLVAVCAGAYYVGQNKYRHWRAGRLAQKAGAFLGKHDLSSAALTAQRGLSIDMTSVDCWKVLAEVGESYQRPEAIYARSRIVQLEKGSLDSVIRCVDTALRMGDPRAAADALEQVPASNRNDGQYQATRGRVGAALGKMDMAVDGYAQALKAAPGNDDYRLAEASARLDRGWIEDRAAARATLEQLSQAPKYQVAALRQLLKDSMANGETTGLLGKARELAAAPGASFADRITLLDFLRQNNDESFRSTLESLETDAAGDSATILALAFWMNRNGYNREAIEWSATFAPEDWADPRVCAAIAVNIFATADWAALQRLTESSDWQRLDYLRCALLARALQQQGKLMDSQAQWRAAVTAAAQVPRATAELARLIADWGWELQLVDLLKTLIKDPKEAGWASRVLLPLVARNKDTTSLWEATSRFMEQEANNDAAANNFAIYSLLLGRDVPHACEVAARLYKQHPSEGSYVSTYAFSLHTLGKTQEALKIMQALGNDQFQSADVAVYYGILLAATRDWVNAPKFLDQSKRITLLPEERLLIREARRQVEEARSEPE